MILNFSLRIFKKEWKKLMLPFLSVLLTSTVISTSFFLVNSAKEFLTEKNKEFMGGDISYESQNNFEYAKLLKGEILNKVDKISDQISFSGILSYKENNISSNIKVIDDNFPLYGKIILGNSDFDLLKENEIYIDENLQKSLSVERGDKLNFNGSEFIVKDIVISDAESLVSGFSFSGKAFLSKKALVYNNTDLTLFRKTFETKIKLVSPLNNGEKEELKSVAKKENIRLRLDGMASGGFTFGLEIVERFLVICILIISILALVNIYSSVNYLANRLRRSFAILISIGMNIESVYKILFIINFLTVFFSTLLGLLTGYFFTKFINMQVLQMFALDLNFKFNGVESLYIFSAILVTSIFATLPVLNKIRKITPKELLSHVGVQGKQGTLYDIVTDVMVGILPLMLLSFYLLDSFWYGLITILAVIGTYVLIMFLYYIFINTLYNKRHLFAFSMQLIIAQKKFDGFLGLVTFASLFFALLSVFSLSIVRTSTEDYLKNNLKQSIPSTYVLDVQSTQKEKLLGNFKNITLYPNVRGRIINIDGLDIQAELAQEVVNIDRELGREFNLTYRNYLLPSEKVVQGKFVGNQGDVSVESEFAKRAGIKIGSNIEFLIQGFEVKAKVTSLREVESRSGNPFFYFVFSDLDLAKFPTTYFGLINQTKDEYNQLTKYLSINAPNVSTIDTSKIAKIAEDLIGVLLLIIFIITLPPLLLAILLIITIISSSAKERKRDGARLMAIGKTHSYLRNYYIVESTSTTFLASISSYVFALLASNYLILKYLKIENLILVDIISICIFIVIIFGIIALSFFLWKVGDKPLKEYLNYEEND